MSVLKTIKSISAVDCVKYSLHHHETQCSNYVNATIFDASGLNEHKKCIHDASNVLYMRIYMLLFT